jgi:hypothetical protein
VVSCQHVEYSETCANSLSSCFVGRDQQTVQNLCAFDAERPTDTDCIITRDPVAQGGEVRKKRPSWSSSCQPGNIPPLPCSPSMGSLTSSTTVGQAPVPSFDPAVSNKLLQEAFASLSLTDKCAFARTISTMTSASVGPTGSSSASLFPTLGISTDTGVDQQSPNNLVEPSPSHLSRLFDNESGLAASMMHFACGGTDQFFEDLNYDVGAASVQVSYHQQQQQQQQQQQLWNTGPLSSDQGMCEPGNAAGSSNNIGGAHAMYSYNQLCESPSRASELDLDSSFDMRSVLSDADKENLGVVMSMMGERELIQVENEVRIIQNNVRGWLLRKNFLNLRSAAKKIMSAWRVRSKRGPNAHSGSGKLSAIQQLPSIQEESMDMDTDSPLLAAFLASSRDEDNNIISSKYNYTMGPAVENDVGDISGNSDHASLTGSNVVDKDEAASKLQAVTRGVIARKSFASLRRQAVASIVIQKSLMHWWVHKDTHSIDAAESSNGQL